MSQGDSHAINSPIFHTPKLPQRCRCRRRGRAVSDVIGRWSGIVAAGAGARLSGKHTAIIIPNLNRRTRGWLRFLWDKATTPNDWGAIDWLTQIGNDPKRENSPPPVMNRIPERLRWRHNRIG